MKRERAMRNLSKSITYLAFLVCACAWMAALPALALDATLHKLAQQEKPLLLDTLRDLVNIESGSYDLEGLEQIAAHLTQRFTALGAKVDMIDGNAEATRDSGSPEKIGRTLRAVFTGKGTKKMLAPRSWPSRRVWVIKIMKPACKAPVINHLRPWTT